MSKSMILSLFTIFFACTPVITEKEQEAGEFDSTQEILKQVLFSDNNTIKSFSEQEGEYILSFSNGVSLSVNRNEIPCYTFDYTGNKLVNGNGSPSYENLQDSVSLEINNPELKQKFDDFMGKGF